MGRHMESLAHHWSRMEVPFDRIVLMSPSQFRVENLGTTTEIELRWFGGRWPNAIWEQVALAHAARNAAILFCPAYTCPYLYGGRIVVANHGIYEALHGEFPWWVRLRATPINRLSVRRADRVIANSLSTRADLIKYFGVPESRLEVILPAANELCFETYSRESICEEVTRVFGEPVRYVIFVGKLAKRRNVPNLIEAFSIVREKTGIPHRLLIIGPNTGNIPLAESIAAAGAGQFVKHLVHAEMLPLAKLYAGADLSVLPTTYEGISQTMFEAMASGTAVLTVEHPTLAEGGGDAVFSLPTPSVDDLVEGLTTLLTNHALRESFVAKGRERAARFSWRRTAETTMSILDRVGLPADRSSERGGV